MKAARGHWGPACPPAAAHCSLWSSPPYEAGPILGPEAHWIELPLCRKRNQVLEGICPTSQGGFEPKSGFEPVVFSRAQSLSSPWPFCGGWEHGTWSPLPVGGPCLHPCLWLTNPGPPLCHTPKERLLDGCCQDTTDPRLPPGIMLGD